MVLNSLLLSTVKLITTTRGQLALEIANGAAVGPQQSGKVAATHLARHGARSTAPPGALEQLKAPPPTWPKCELPGLPLAAVSQLTRETDAGESTGATSRHSRVLLKARPERAEWQLIDARQVRGRGGRAEQRCTVQAIGPEAAHKCACAPADSLSSITILS